MTRKDYILIADALNSVRPFDNLVSKEEMMRWEKVVGAMTGRLRRTNPRFNADKFIAACGIKHNPATGWDTATVAFGELCNV